MNQFILKQQKEIIKNQKVKKSTKIKIKKGNIAKQILTKTFDNKGNIILTETKKRTIKHQYKNGKIYKELETFINDKKETINKSYEFLFKNNVQECYTDGQLVMKKYLDEKGNNKLIEYMSVETGEVRLTDLFTYDANNNIIRKERNGIIITNYTYSNDNRIIRMDVYNTHLKEYLYDELFEYEEDTITISERINGDKDIYFFSKEGLLIERRHLDDNDEELSRDIYLYEFYEE